MEQEINVLMLGKDYGSGEALDYFFRSHSSSTDGRRVTDLFENDPKNGFVINMPSEDSRAVEMLNAYLKTMGYKINIQYDESADDPVIAECDIPKIPNYIKNLL